VRHFVKFRKKKFIKVIICYGNVYVSSGNKTSGQILNEWVKKLKIKLFGGRLKTLNDFS
jgi:hypothetical protein